MGSLRFLSKNTKFSEHFINCHKKAWNVTETAFPLTKFDYGNAMSMCVCVLPSACNISPSVITFIDVLIRKQSRNQSTIIYSYFPTLTGCECAENIT